MEPCEGNNYSRSGFFPTYQNWQNNYCLNHMGCNCKNTCIVYASEGKAVMVTTNHGDSEDKIKEAMKGLFEFL